MSTVDLFFSTVRSVFDVLRAERIGEESTLDTLSRLTREAAAHRQSMSRPEPAPQNQGGPALWPIIIAELERDSVTMGDPTLALVAKDARERHDLGVAKYGVPLVAKNGRDHLRDAYQEALDAVVYLRANAEATKTDDAFDMYLAALAFACGLREAIK